MSPISTSGRDLSGLEAIEHDPAPGDRGLAPEALARPHQDQPVPSSRGRGQGRVVGLSLLGAVLLLSAPEAVNAFLGAPEDSVSSTHVVPLGGSEPVGVKELRTQASCSLAGAQVSAASEYSCGQVALVSDSREGVSDFDRTTRRALRHHLYREAPELLDEANVLVDHEPGTQVWTATVTNGQDKHVVVLDQVGSDAALVTTLSGPGQQVDEMVAEMSEASNEEPA